MSRPKFKSGEKVLVPHTDKHYPAKVSRSVVPSLKPEVCLFTGGSEV